MVLLLKLFQPSRVIHLIVAFGAADCRGKDPRLVSDGAIVQGQPLTDTVLHPLG